MRTIRRNNLADSSKLPDSQACLARSDKFLNPASVVDGVAGCGASLSVRCADAQNEENNSASIAMGRSVTTSRGRTASREECGCRDNISFVSFEFLQFRYSYDALQENNRLTD